MTCHLVGYLYFCSHGTAGPGYPRSLGRWLHGLELLHLSSPCAQAASRDHRQFPHRKRRQGKALQGGTPWTQGRTPSPTLCQSGRTGAPLSALSGTGCAIKKYIIFLKEGAKSRTCIFLNNPQWVKSHPCSCSGGIPLAFQHTARFPPVSSRSLLSYVRKLKK